jgi:hypothetical protein
MPVGASFIISSFEDLGWAHQPDGRAACSRIDVSPNKYGILPDRANEGWRPLSEVAGGDFCFAVRIFDCVRAHLNIVPHRYRVQVSEAAFSHSFDDLSDAQTGALGSLVMRDELSGEEVCELHELRERQWLGTLPTPEATEALIQEQLPFRIEARRPLWLFLKTFDLSAPFSAVRELEAPLLHF